MKIKMTPCTGLIMLTLALVLALPALAQQSTNYRLDEHVLNSGGNPDNGVELTSTRFTVSMVSIGDGVVARGLSSSSFRMDAGFTNTYLLAGEVNGLLFLDKHQLQWDSEPSIGVYNLYRDLISNLSGLGYGTCVQQYLTSTGASDSDPVPDDDGYFYIVTAENRLGEEGSKGFQNGGIERQGSVCP
jgi:hypothetical protein